ncbi:MAG: hypothetical protein HPY85_01560 [Anaerolineae bacterium]|nr:hypothetical protein [Anaerolineae bacterium]
MMPSQAIHALITKGTANYVGLMGSPWRETYVNWVRQGYPTRMIYHRVGETRWDPEDGNWVTVVNEGDYPEPVPAWEVFDYDLVGVSPWFNQEPLIDHKITIEENEEWAIHENGSGAHLKYWKHKMGTPEHISFKMTSREVWERDYRPYLVNWNPQRFKLSDMRKSYHEGMEANRWVHMGHQFIWENMRQSMGDVCLYESLLLDPDWVHDYNRVTTDFYKRAFRYMFDEVGLPHGIWLYEDLGYKNGIFASPRVFKNLIFPYYAEMVAFFHSFGLPVVLHSCGSVAQAMPLIVDAGFDALNPIERKADHNDPFDFAGQYGDSLAFIGGLDVRVLETNDRDVIVSETTTLIEGMKKRNARFIFCEDHSLPPTIHLDSYHWMLDTYHRLKFY